MAFLAVLALVVVSVQGPVVVVVAAVLLLAFLALLAFVLALVQGPQEVEAFAPNGALKAVGEVVRSLIPGAR